MLSTQHPVSPGRRLFRANPERSTATEKKSRLLKDSQNKSEQDGISVRAAFSMKCGLSNADIQPFVSSSRLFFVKEVNYVNDEATTPQLNSSIIGSWSSHPQAGYSRVTLPSGKLRQGQTTTEN
ncbi:hypothetical protein BaRGS_00013433 [Batillaria attramentaria]|uniref:Uncharacterized protein n=1 Tax=Batillaria attramentaria TaxID=370345 RepID=A0ABD0L6U2_9CAEN